MNDLITIVVPIYNVEKYLRKCIDSIIQQTYKNLEIILIDDGSTDDSGKICDEYKNQQRIKVIHKQNGGLSDARNIGIDNANGKYITFVDSDDFITKDSIEVLYKNIIKGEKEISIGQVSTFSNENNIKDYNCNEKINIYNKKDSIEQLLYNTKYTSSTAGKLFCTHLFKNIRFPYGKKYEDLAILYKLIYESNGVVVSNKVVYNYYTARQDSIMNENFNSTRMDALYFTEEILEFIQKNFPDIEIAAITRLIIECRDIIVEIPQNSKYKKYEDYIYNYIKKYRLRTLLNRKLPLKRRISLLPILFGKKAIKIAWKVKTKIL